MAFHAPERARDTTHPLLATDADAGNNGVFDVDSCEPGWRLALILSDGDGWEHVSVHGYRLRGAASDPQLRAPTWKEMSHIKRLCWDAEDVVMQLHPRESEYINCHRYVLHLWRPIGREIPTPPPELVGPRARSDHAQIS